MILPAEFDYNKTCEYLLELLVISLPTDLFVFLAALMGIKEKVY